MVESAVSILVVEDELIVAEDLAAAVESNGLCGDGGGDKR